jgi:hypothetical protein
VRGLSYSILAVAEALTLAASASASTGVLYKSGNASLTEDHVGAVIITASNTTLNCNGNTVYSDGIDHCNGPDCAIEIVGKSNVKLINCRVEEHSAGVLAVNSSNVTLANVVAKFNFVGVHVENVNNFPARGPSGSILRYFQGYFSYSGEEGIRMSGSNQIIFSGLNRFRSNERDGLDCELSNFEMLQGPDSYAINNGRNGLELDSCPNSTITWFTATTNGKNEERSGISVDNSDNVDVSYCTTNGNSRNGIRVAIDSDGGQYVGNSALDNEDYDMYQEPESTNSWIGNSYGSKFGF